MLDTTGVYAELIEDGNLSGSDWAIIGQNVLLNGMNNLAFGQISEIFDLMKANKATSSVDLNKIANGAEDASEGIKLDNFKQFGCEVNSVELKKGTWELGACARGDVIDEALGNNLGHNYPVIDRIEDGVITSVKSRDLSAVSYQECARLESQLKNDIDNLDSFKGRKWNGITVRSSDINIKQLQIVLPDIEPTSQQVTAISNAIEYAQNKGIEIIITIGKETGN